MSGVIIAFLVVFALFALLRNSEASSRRACPICQRYFTLEHKGQRACSAEHDVAIHVRSAARQERLGRFFAGLVLAILVGGLIYKITELVL